MSPADNYKKIETRVAEKLLKFLQFIGTTIVLFFKFIIQKGKQRFTVMFIPHSEKKIINFHISIFSLIFISVLLVVIVIGFFGLSTYFTGARERYEQVSLDLMNSKSSIEKFETEIDRLSRSSDAFKNAVNELFKVFGKEEAEALIYSGRGGDLLSMNENNALSLESSQLVTVQELTNYINSIQKPIMAVTDIIERQKELLMHTPNLWPVMSRTAKAGRITAYFGPELHPIKNNFRLHNGVDIAWTRGTPIVATANGTIENINYDPNGLGNNITIRHKKYGFKTRYGHLDKILVNRGQYVERGDIIGYMGSTGMSTGSHLHYEVWIGEQVVDPMQYLDMNIELIE